MKLSEMRANVQREMDNLDRQAENDKREIRAILADAEGRGYNALSAEADARAEALLKSARIAEAARARKADTLAQIDVLEAEERAVERQQNIVIDTPAARRGKPAYDEVMRVSAEARQYSRDNDPEGKGTGFLTDVVAAYRGNPQANERLARHAREYEVDNNGRKTRAAGRRRYGRPA